MNFIIFITALLSPDLLVGNLLMIETLTASMMTTPVAYKLFKNKGGIDYVI